MGQLLLVILKIVKVECLHDVVTSYACGSFAKAQDDNPVRPIRLC